MGFKVKGGDESSCEVEEKYYSPLTEYLKYDIKKALNKRL